MSSFHFHFDLPSQFAHFDEFLVDLHLLINDLEYSVLYNFLQIKAYKHLLLLKMDEPFDNVRDLVVGLIYQIKEIQKSPLSSFRIGGIDHIGVHKNRPCRPTIEIQSYSEQQQ